MECFTYRISQQYRPSWFSWSAQREKRKTKMSNTTSSYTEYTHVNKNKNHVRTSNPYKVQRNKSFKLQESKSERERERERKRARVPFWKATNKDERSRLLRLVRGRGYDERSRVADIAELIRVSLLQQDGVVVMGLNVRPMHIQAHCSFFYNFFFEQKNKISIMSKL